MPKAHRHNDIEIGFIERGRCVVVHGGHEIALPTGFLILFWATVPHQVTRVKEPGSSFVLPLALNEFLSWKIGGPLVQRILSGEMVFESDAAESDRDQMLLARWLQDFGSKNPTPELRKITQLEIEARLRRLGLSLQNATTPAPNHISPKESMDKAGRMAAYIAEHCTENIRIDHVAHTVGMHPKSAARLFCKSWGVSLMEFVQMSRIHQAQRLLLSTDKKILDVALESGFGSAPCFYSTFRRIAGQTPRAYRAMAEHL